MGDDDGRAGDGFPGAMMMVMTMMVAMTMVMMVMMPGDPVGGWWVDDVRKKKSPGALGRAGARGVRAGARGWPGRRAGAGATGRAGGDDAGRAGTRGDPGRGCAPWLGPGGARLSTTNDERQ